MIVPVFSSADQTHHTNYSGDKTECPVYLSLRNIDSTIKMNPSNFASILVALLPVPPKCTHQGHLKTTAVEEQRIHNREDLRNDFELIFWPFDEHVNIGKHIIVQMVVCGNVILSSVHGRLISSKTFSGTQSSSPIALCVKHRNHLLEMWIHCRHNWKRIVYTSKRW